MHPQRRDHGGTRHRWVPRGGGRPHRRSRTRDSGADRPHPRRAACANTVPASIAAAAAAAAAAANHAAAAVARRDGLGAAGHRRE